MKRMCSSTSGSFCAARSESCENVRQKGKRFTVSPLLVACVEEIQLRHVEKDVLIPKMMREKAKERCAEKVEAFNHCCKESGFFMVFKCRDQNAALKECLTAHYKDPVFFDECKQEYIREKLEFERTGVPAKNRKQKLPTSM